MKEEIENIAPNTWKNMLKFPHIATLILLAFVVVALHLTRNNDDIVHLQNLVFHKEDRIRHENNSTPVCNLFSGKWIYDNSSYPLYKEKQCSFMENDFACETNGRKDLKYQHWRWQPHHCDLPRFNGTALLERLRGKKLVFIGDSLNRNQWRSMLCLIDSYLPPSSKKSVGVKGNLLSFHSIEYNATIGFYWEPMLVESNGDNIFIHRKQTRAVRIKSIVKHGRHWKDADILVFDSFAWWMDETIQLVWGSFESPDAIYRTIEMKLRRYEIALNTWSDWLEMHINPNKTKLFFMSLSPYRVGNTTWGTDHTCHDKTEPILNENYWPSGANMSMMRIVESTIEKLKERGVKVEYMNITRLSANREDGHPSIHRPFWRSVTKEEIQNDIPKYSDCLHWCLPGVPDVWNQILYSYIMKL
ncbi:hypothetical protein ACP275_10G011100 [Erythranthe tilingii]